MAAKVPVNILSEILERKQQRKLNIIKVNLVYSNYITIHASNTLQFWVNKLPRVYFYFSNFNYVESFLFTALSVKFC